MVLDDLDGDGQLQGLVVVNDEVAESGHPLEGVCQCGVYPAVCGQKVEGIPGPLGYAQALTADQVLAHVDGGVAGALDVEDGGVLSGVVGLEPLGVGVVLLPRTGNAAFDGGRLVDQDIIRHGASPWVRAGWPGLLRRRGLVAGYPEAGRHGICRDPIFPCRRRSRTGRPGGPWPTSARRSG